MKPDANNKDPAFPVMAMDILSNVLSRADNPGELGDYLTEEVRDLTGARCVLLIQCLSTATVIAHRVVTVNPLRRREWAESQAGHRLFEIVHRVPAAQLWRGEDPAEVAGLLQPEGFKLSMVFPLHAGGLRVGAMLVLGLPDEEHVTSVLELLNNLSTIVALVLRNAVLYEKQEQLIQERTADLRDNNKKLAEELVERKKAEEALRESEKRYKQLLGSVTDYIYTVQVEAGRSVATVHGPGCVAVTGYTPEDYAADAGLWYRMIYEPDRAAVMEQAAKILSGEAALPLEHRLLHRDGSMRWVRNTPVPRYDARRHLMAYDGLIEDITERKRVEEALRKSEERFRRIAENARDMIYRMSLPDGKYEYVSPAALSVVGFSPEEYYATPMLIRQAIHPDWHEYFEEQWANLIKGKMPPTYEYQFIHKSGEVRWLNQRNILVCDDAGTPIAIEGIITDITERKFAEEEIRRLNEELEQRVTDRTAQLEAAIKEHEAFTYSMAHDLRAPLRHLDGFIELLQKRTTTTLDTQSQHYMANISDSAKRMGTLIDELLSFSRRGRYEMSKIQVDLGALVPEVIQELAPEAVGRKINWHIAALPVVTGDHTMLRTVLVNLLSNALKFTRPRQEAEIEIGWMRDRETETVIFVRDNGVGFDMNYVDKLFGVFQRLHRADEFEGTGIGLANVRRIINRHGGQTWAEGKINQGATFYFSLPPSI